MASGAEQPVSDTTVESCRVHDCPHKGGDVPWVTPFELHLTERMHALKDEVGALYVRPIPDADDPGWQVYRALMEDLRESGGAHLTVRHRTIVEVCYEPA